MYLDYWALSRNPFDNVPDPGMYFSSHDSVEGTVAELLFAIEEGNECLAVVVGEVGLGKTMSLRVVLNELNPEKYRIAFITNPDLTFVQLMREIIGQIVGQACQIREKDQLLEEFNRLLFETADSGRRVLVFIDEGNALRSSCLEGLRLLTNMQEDSNNLLTLILAGQPKLGRMLEDPRRANLFQRIGVYARLVPLDSVEKVRDYVNYRLEKAGRQSPIFTEEALEVLFEQSDGIPRLVNRLCKVSLKAGETNQLEVIDGELVAAIAERFEPQFRTVPKKAKSRRSGKKSRKTAKTSKSKKAVSRAAEVAPAASATVEESTLLPDSKDAPIVEAAVEEPVVEAVGPIEETMEAAALEAAPAAVSDPEPEVPEAPPAAESLPAPESVAPFPVEVKAHAPLQVAAGPSNGNGRPSGVAELPAREALVADGYKIPQEVVEALRNLPDQRQRLRLAGQLAARQIQEHPERYTGAVLDPVRAWDQLREEILQKVS